MSQTPLTFWDLIAKLADESKQMTGNELVDKICLNRGAGYVQRFRQENPIWAALIENFITGTPEAALFSLSMIRPEIANSPLALPFLTELQKMLITRKE